VVYNPDNVYDNENVLENFQALCFQASLHNIPTIIINPFLVSTSWSDSGHRSPLLLSDFINAYFICDDYFMVNVNSFCGIVQRAAQTDLYLLNNFKNDVRLNTHSIHSLTHLLTHSLTHTGITVIQAHQSQCKHGRINPRVDARCNLGCITKQ
jgi:hypothetical protein